MRLKVLLAIMAFLGGPSLALAVLTIACGRNSSVGVMCGHNVGTSVIGLTLFFWFVLACLAALIHSLITKQ